jgi:2-amino-4-hydroxy-6-hydroxymethyldihydropteridine diphosphokinase
LILIALGSNLDGLSGSPEDTLAACVSAMSVYGLTCLRASSIWKTAPVPVSDQPWYRNAVCAVDTELCPADLLVMLKSIERDLGRIGADVVNAPRVIDLDLIAYHGEVMDMNPVLPHPRLHERAFVLYPLNEIAPEWRHPVLGKSVEQMIADLPKGQDLERIEGIKLC